MTRNELETALERANERIIQLEELNAQTIILTKTFEASQPLLQLALRDASPEALRTAILLLHIKLAERSVKEVADLAKRVEEHWDKEMTQIPSAEKIEEFLRKKYVVRADSRQRGLGLSYITAETKDLAKTIHKFLS